MGNRNKGKQLAVRVSDEVFKMFREKSASYGNGSDVLKELVMAFIEDRLTVQPPENAKRSLYHVGNQDSNTN